MQRKANVVLTTFEVLSPDGRSSDLPRGNYTIRRTFQRTIWRAMEYAITFGLAVLAAGWILGERW